MQAKRTAIYCRVALANDFAMENQRNAMRRYAEENGYTEYTEYLDNGESGTTLDRPAFARLCNDMNEQKIQAVFIKDVSRISRNMIDIYSFLETAKGLDVKVISQIDDLQNPIFHFLNGE